MSERRLIAVLIPAQEIANLILSRCQVRGLPRTPVEQSQPFPDDTHCVRTYYDPDTESLVLVCEHEDFPTTAPTCQMWRVGVTSLREYVEGLETRVDDCEQHAIERGEQ